MIGQVECVPQQLSARIYDVSRFTAKFVPLFKVHMEDVKDKARLWTIVQECATALDMLKAAVLYNQYFPNDNQAEIRDARAWFNVNPNPLSRDLIVSGLNYFYSGLGKEHPEMNDLEVIEAAYHLNNHALFHRLKQEFQVKLYRTLASQNLSDIVRLANQIENSSFKDDSISAWSSKLSHYLGRKLIDSKDRLFLIAAYRHSKVQSLTFNASFGSAFSLDDELMDMLGSVDSLKSLEFVGVDVRLIKIPRRLISLKLNGFSKSKDNNLNLAPMSLQTFEISQSNIDKDFFVGMPPVVKRLSIVQCEALEDEFIEFVPIVLTHLDVSNCVKLTDKFLRRLPKKLLSLNLWCVPGISDRGMLKLKALECLKELNIHGTSVTDAGMDSIPKGVDRLWLGEKITDIGLLDAPPRLTFLDLRDNKNFSRKVFCSLSSTIQEINLSMTNITDEDVCALPAGLLVLDISNTQVKRPQLPIGLLTLTVRHTSITDFSILKPVSGLIHFATSSSFELKHVPRNAVCLTLDFSSLTTLDDLPPNLLILNLSFARKLKAEELRKVPRSVQLVDITDSGIELNQAKGYLPAGCIIIQGTEIHELH